MHKDHDNILAFPLGMWSLVTAPGMPETTGSECVYG